MQAEIFRLRDREYPYYYQANKQRLPAVPDLSDMSGGLSNPAYFNFVSYIIWKVVARGVTGEEGRARLCRAAGVALLAEVASEQEGKLREAARRGAGGRASEAAVLQATMEVGGAVHAFACVLSLLWVCMRCWCHVERSCWLWRLPAAVRDGHHVWLHEQQCLRAVCSRSRGVQCGAAHAQHAWRHHLSLAHVYCAPVHGVVSAAVTRLPYMHARLPYMLTCMHTCCRAAAGPGGAACRRLLLRLPGHLGQLAWRLASGLDAEGEAAGGAA